MGLGNAGRETSEERAVLTPNSLAVRRNMTSSDDALLLLRKWNSEKSPISVLMALSFGTAVFSGRIEDLHVSSMSVRIVGFGPRSEFTFNLGSSKFHFGDAREVPADLRAEAQQYEHFLTATTESGDMVSFYELRPNV